MHEATEQYLTLSQAARSIGPCTPRTLLNEIHRGVLPATRVGSRWLVSRDDLATYLAPTPPDGDAPTAA